MRHHAPCVDVGQGFKGALMPILFQLDDAGERLRGIGGEDTLAQTGLHSSAIVVMAFV